MLERKTAQNVLAKALEGGASFAELFIEDKEELNIKYTRHTVQEIAQARLYGVGVYVISGGSSAYVYLNDLREAALLRAVDTAVDLLTARSGGGTAAPLAAREAPVPCPVAVYPATVAHADKIKLLENTWYAAHSASDLITNLSLDYFDTDQRVLIANTEGVWAEDRRVTSRIRMIPTLSRDDRSAGHFSDYTRPQGFEAFTSGAYMETARERIRDIHQELFAEEAPSGFFPVVLEGGACAGTFFHEACGHQLETARLTDDSIFRHKMGTKIASEKVTLIDDGTLPGQYGSSAFDDEGMPRQRNLMIENGVLKCFLADRLGAIRLSVPRTASGRRQSYAYAPSSRMSNTFLAAGSDDNDEMLRSMPEGLFVTEIGGGSGGEEFTLLAKKAYWIKNGQLDRQVKGAMLLGRGDKTMLDIDRVGSTLVYEKNGGFCGSGSGLCCTTTSGARMRVTGMLVGGKGGKG